MRARRLYYALLTAATLGIASAADAASVTREPLSTTANAANLRARLGSGIADWRSVRPEAKVALARVGHGSALKVEGVLARLDGIIGRLDSQLKAPRLTSAQIAELTQQLQSDEDKLREAVKQAREEAKTGFEDADQRTNQLLNILVGILRTMNDMRAGNCKGCL